MTPVQATAVIGITLRTTRLLGRDTITEPLRKAAENRYGDAGFLPEMLRCPWCLSVWVASGVTIGALILPERLLAVAGLTAWASYITGVAATWLEGA